MQAIRALGGWLGEGDWHPCRSRQSRKEKQEKKTSLDTVEYTAILFGDERELPFMVLQVF